MSHTLASNRYHEQNGLKKKNVGERRLGHRVNVKLLSKEKVYPLGKNTENISNSILRQRPNVCCLPETHLKQ